MAATKPEQNDVESKAIASIPQAVRTVNLSVVISLVSLIISLFTLFWNVRPARVEPVLSAVFLSSAGGTHISIPLSIVNRGAQPTAVLAVKLYESVGNRHYVWNADFTAESDRAIPAMTGALTPTNAALWVPFMVPGNGQVERVFIFRQVDVAPDHLAASGRRVSYRVVLLLSGNGEAATSTDILWPAMTDGVLKQAKGGVGSMGSEIDRWLSEPAR